MAKSIKKNKGLSLKSLIEDGLRLKFKQLKKKSSYKMKDCRVGNPNNTDPLKNYTWSEIRDEIYTEGVDFFKANLHLGKMNKK